MCPPQPPPAAKSRGRWTGSTGSHSHPRQAPLSRRSEISSQHLLVHTHMQLCMICGARARHPDVCQVLSPQQVRTVFPEAQGWILYERTAGPQVGCCLGHPVCLRRSQRAGRGDNLARSCMDLRCKAGEVWPAAQLLLLVFLALCRPQARRDQRESARINPRPHVMATQFPVPLGAVYVQQVAEWDQELREGRADG